METSLKIPIEPSALSVSQEPCDVRSCANRSFGECIRCMKCSFELSEGIANTFVIESSLKPSYAVSQPYCESYGAAVDLGTTTIVLALCRATDGAVLSTVGCVNPQRAIAPDVMSRVEASLSGRRDQLQDMVIRAIEGLLARACEEARIPQESVDAFVVTGNTIMLHLLVGEDVGCLARMPFAVNRTFGEELAILGRKAYLPTCFDSFLGADLNCALLAARATGMAQPALVCDIGTNGEVALWKDEALYLASVPAGPCFEGAELSCGCGSVEGAVDGVSYEDGEIKVRTIGDAPPIGICGSGVIEAVDAFVQRGDISEGGRSSSDSLVVCEGVTLTQADVRAVQLAKAAVSAGIEVVMESAGANASFIESFCVCGGFGSRMNLAGASRIGLIPAGLQEKATVLGNAALEGAVMTLLDQGNMAIMEAACETAQCISLVGNARFEDCYVDNMGFIGTDDLNEE